MLVARVLYPVEVLGPGKRVGIWLCGCNHRCKGCSNPELWNFDMRYEISIDNVTEILNSIKANYRIDGFTITGGDPFEQADQLAELVEKLKLISSDILVYTGFTLQELVEKNNTSIEYLLHNIAVLIDGRYKEERNNNVILRGSDNQKIHILNDIYKEKYQLYLSSVTNQIQNFKTENGVISVGIHKPDFINQLNNYVKELGLQKEE